ncbi:filamentous hemagglutinin family N-terminal domain-containing protein, partial [Noviherbaspirillum humi]
MHTTPAEHLDTALGTNAPRRSCRSRILRLRLGRTRLTLVWRPRKLPSLLWRKLLLRACIGLLGMTASARAQVPPNTLPTGAQVAAGSASVSQSGSAMTVTQSTPKAILNWNSFDIGPSASVTFNQPSRDAVALNRVVGISPSQIQGQLNANGQVFLVNPQGILFGPTAQVNVGGLAASTLSISDADFMSGNYRFERNGGRASVVNQGRLTAADAGYIALLAPEVINEGVITARLGTAAMAAGEAVTLDMQGDGKVGVKVDAATISTLVENRQMVLADGGVVYLGAKAAGQLASAIVSNAGTVKAASMVNRNGTIRLEAAGGRVRHSGIIDVRGVDGDGGEASILSEAGNVALSGRIDARGRQGGRIDVHGRDIEIKGAALDASGQDQGGAIRIGGDYRGGGEMPHARTVLVDEGSHLLADAGENGAGGRIIVWSDDFTRFEGTLSARGGTQGGNGGFAEVSGKRRLAFEGQVDLRAPRGTMGTLLLDPTDITISNSANSGSSASTAPGTTTYTGSGTTSNLSVATLQNTLQTASVVVDTSSADSGNGDITVADPISWNGYANLTLQATRDVNINAPITNTLSGSLYVTGRDINFNTNQPISMGVSLTANATRDINVNGNIATGATGSTRLVAAGGNIFGTGRVNFLSPTTLQVGTGGLVLTSGDNGGRSDLTNVTLDYADPSKTFGGGLTIQGFNDITLTTAGNQTLKSNYITVTAFRDLNVSQDISSIGSIFLNSAGADIFGVGRTNFTAPITITQDFGQISMTSGSNGGRANLTNVTFDFVNANKTVSTFVLDGFNDITLKTNGNAALASKGFVSVRAFGDLNISQDVSSVGLMELRGGFQGGPGRLNFTAPITIGLPKASVTLVSGNHGGYADMTNVTFDYVDSSKTTNAILISGFNDMTVKTAGNQALAATSGGISINAMRDINISQDIKVGPSDPLTLVAAGANFASGTGRINVASPLTFTLGTGQTRIWSGINAGRPTFNNITFDYASPTKQFGAVNLRGFSDMTLHTVGNQPLVSNSNILAIAYGNIDFGIDLTSGAGPTDYLQFITTGSVTQTGGKITTNLLRGSAGTTASFTQSGNMVSTLGPFTSNGLALVDNQSLATNGAVSSGTGATSITANGSLTVSHAISGATNTLVANGAGSDIVLNTGASVTSSASGNSLVLSAGRGFVNNVGASALNAGSGRWLVYSASPGVDTFGNLNSNNTAIWNGTFASLAPGSIIQTGNRYVFSAQPTLTVNVTGSLSKTYGQDASAAVNALGYTVSGYQGAVSGAFLGDTAASAIGTGPVLYSAGAGAGANAASYSVIADVSSATSPVGYAFASGTPGSLTVTPAPITVTSTDVSKVYDGTTSASGSLIITAGSLYNGNTLTGGTFAFADKNAGAGKTVLVSGVTANDGNGGNNYSISYTSNTNSTISPRLLTVAASGQNKVYDGTATATVTFSDDRIAGDVLAINYATANFADKHAGTGKSVTVSGMGKSGVDAGNYVFASTNASATADITPAPLTIAADDKSKVYGDANPTLTATYAGLVGADTAAALTGTLNLATSATAASNAGTYAIIPSGQSSGDYSISYVPGTLSITPAPLTVSAENTSRQYGLSNPAFSASYSGFKNSDSASSLGGTLAFSTAATAASNVGGYSVTPSGYSSSNYSISYAPGTLSVTPAPITVSTANVVKTYDGTTSAAGSPIITSGALYNGNTLSGGSYAFLDKNAGTGKTVSVSGVTVSDGHGGGNYSVTYASNTGSTINPKPLTVTAAGQDKVYDGTAAATVTLSDNRIAGDILSTSYASAVFGSKNAGANQAVTVSG